jgi:hypothetical protein
LITHIFSPRLDNYTKRNFPKVIILKKCPIVCEVRVLISSYLKFSIALIDITHAFWVLGFGRPETGISNIKYRLKLKKKTEEKIDSLIIRKKELQNDIRGLKQSIQELNHEIYSSARYN